MENCPYTIWCQDFSIHETKQLTDIFQKSNCTVRKSSIAMTSLERHQRHQRHSKASTTRTSRTQTRRPRVTTSCRASSHHPPWRRAARARTKKSFGKKFSKTQKSPVWWRHQLGGEAQQRCKEAQVRVLDVLVSGRPLANISGEVKAQPRRSSARNGRGFEPGSRDLRKNFKPRKPEIFGPTFRWLLLTSSCRIVKGGWNQCDQMLELNVAKFVQLVPTAVFPKKWIFSKQLRPLDRLLKFPSYYFRINPRSSQCHILFSELQNIFYSGIKYSDWRSQVFRLVLTNQSEHIGVE